MREENLLYNLADHLVKIVYKETLNFPFRFQSSVGDQLRRAILSVVLNIVEGGARKSVKERRQFLNIAFASLKESKYLVSFAFEFKLINETFYEEIMKEINRLASVLYGLLYKDKT